MTEAPDSTRPAAETEQTAPSAADFVIEDGVLTDWKGEGETVTVPRGVTEIGRRAFFGRRGLREVVIPDGVRTIGESICNTDTDNHDGYTFSGCSPYITITLPASVREAPTAVTVSPFKSVNTCVRAPRMFSCAPFT